jgi:hypothetical protein
VAGYHQEEQTTIKPHIMMLGAYEQKVLVKIIGNAPPSTSNAPPSTSAQ